MHQRIKEAYLEEIYCLEETIRATETLMLLTGTKAYEKRIRTLKRFLHEEQTALEQKLKASEERRGNTMETGGGES